MERILTFLSTTKMIVISAVCIIASLILSLNGIIVPIDPAWGAVVICGFSIFYWAIVGIFIDHKIYTSLLISIAMVASIAIGELFAAGEIALIMAIGGKLEEKTVERAHKGLKKLINLAPTEGRLISSDGLEQMISADQIKSGDILRVLPGEAIPIDGDIVLGNTSIDQSIMTGESLPVDKGIGDSVYCGTINRFGSVDIKATKVGEDSSLQKLIRLIKEAESNQAPTQRIVDKWASWLVPIALLIAVIAFFATGEIVRAVTVLVVFCPCALVLATPTSIVAAIGQATKKGVLIKSGDALERMGKVDMIAFDKTGTLTYGRLIVSDVLSFSKDMTEDDILSIAASAEARSEHPLGKAIMKGAEERGLAVSPSEDFQMLPGKGISAIIQGNTILCGNHSWLLENGVSFNEDMEKELGRFRNQGKATIIISKDNEVIGILALSDTIRPEAKEMINSLRNEKTSTVLLTGDHKQTAEYFAETVGFSEVYAELLPVEKVNKINELKERGANICMIGDGVNDAPALKTANVGVAMGGIGSDIAIEAADIALMGDDISLIPYLKRLSNATVTLIKFNITLAMCINFVAILLSFLGVLTPVTGALWHNIGSILVVLNAARLYDRKFI